MSNFGEIPEIISSPDHGKMLVPILYEHENRAFRVGQKVVEINNPECEWDLFSPNQGFVDASQILDHPLHMGTLSHPITTPRFFTWFKDFASKSDLDETCKVMYEVFHDLTGTEIDEKQLNNTLSVHGFSAGRIRPGHANLHVIGDCANSAPEPDGLMIDLDDWGTGFAEYGFHNIDTIPQRISLSAGLGHLALLSTKASTDQLRLF